MAGSPRKAGRCHTVFGSLYRLETQIQLRRISTPVAYAPITVPPPMTIARQMAYRRREIPPSPDIDPDGWRHLPPVSIQGTFNDQTTLTIGYTLSLATPVCTRAPHRF